MSALSEFALIRQYLTNLGSARADVALDIGDDCALLCPPPGHDLAITTDTLVAGVHFFADCDPTALGHKALAVSLSDLAAVGAEPTWATLALTLPEARPDWLAGFARGFDALARAHGVRLVGGDTTRGPLSLTVQALGLVPTGQGITRAGARPGDLLVVSGALGDAGLALRRLTAEGAGRIPMSLRDRLERPTPRVALGIALRGLASAAVDISDGLAADLGHLLAASGQGAEIRLADLPLSPEVAAAVADAGDWELPLTAGDDYELCFTLPPHASEALPALSAAAGCRLSLIGRVEARAGARWHDPAGNDWPLTGPAGFEHFATA